MSKKERRGQTWAVGNDLHTRQRGMRHEGRAVWDVNCSCRRMTPVLGLTATDAAAAWRAHVEEESRARGLPVVKDPPLSDPDTSLPRHLQGGEQ